MGLLIDNSNFENFSSRVEESRFFKQMTQGYEPLFPRDKKVRPFDTYYVKTPTVPLEQRHLDLDENNNLKDYEKDIINGDLWGIVTSKNRGPITPK